jgi:hypothetical protein
MKPVRDWTRPRYDAELEQLYDQVLAIFGEAACCDSNNRAFDCAAFAKDRDPEEWLGAFHIAWKAELRRLLRPH